MPTAKLNILNPSFEMIKDPSQGGCTYITDVRSKAINPALPLNAGCVIFEILIANNIKEGSNNLIGYKWYVLDILEVFKSDNLPLRICEDIVVVKISLSSDDKCKDTDISNIIVEVDYV